MQKNEMMLSFSALSQNEAFARVVVSAFAAQLSPTVGELADVKTAVSEAVTNAIIHGYGGKGGVIELYAIVAPGELNVQVVDKGRGIEDVAAAMEPFFTTGDKEERSGMGFTVMSTFMDSLEVVSSVGQGTTVKMTKRIGGERQW